MFNDSLGGCEFSVESDGAYVTYTVGADTVTKKLGNINPIIKQVIATAEYQSFSFTHDNDITIAYMVSVDNSAFQATYNKESGSINGYGVCAINVDDSTITYNVGKQYGRWLFVYC